MYIVLKTERLILRPIQLQDASFLLRLMNSEGWLKYIGDRNIKDIGDSEKYIQGILSHSNFFYHVIELNHSGEPIGIVTFLYREDYVHPDIGFAMLPAFEKMGYASEAAGSYLTYIHRHTGVEKVIAISMPANKGSIRVLDKLGMTYKETLAKDNGPLAIFEISNPYHYPGKE